MSQSSKAYRDGARGVKGTFNRRMRRYLPLTADQVRAHLAGKSAEYVADYKAGRFDAFAGKV